MKLPVGHVAGSEAVKATAFGGLGQKLLEKHGWEKGQGLGREKHGISKAIEVQKKEDQLGVGADRKPSWDWTENFWDKAFNSAVAQVNHTGNSSESSSDDSSSEEDEPLKHGRGAAVNRDGTLASASNAELKLAAELAKDPWGRWGGRGGKMARIREHEAAEASQMRESLGLSPSQGTNNVQSKASSSGRSEQREGSDAASLGVQQKGAKKGIVFVVSIKDEPKRKKFIFKPTPASGWWGAAYFTSAGAMGALEEEMEALHEKVGFNENDQEKLYMLCHDHQRVGKKGLGKSSVLKIEGGNWEGKKVVFEDDEGKAGDKSKTLDKATRRVLKAATKLLKAAPKGRMKLGKLFKELKQSDLGQEALKSTRRGIKKGRCEGFQLNDKFVSIIACARIDRPV